MHSICKLNCKKAWRWPIIKVETCKILVHNKSSCAGRTKSFIIDWYTSSTSWCLPSKSCDCLFITASHLVRWLLVLRSFLRLDIWLKGWEVATSYLVPHAECVVASVRGFLDPLLWLYGPQISKIETSQNFA